MNYLELRENRADENYMYSGPSGEWGGIYPLTSQLGGLKESRKLQGQGRNPGQN